MKSDYPKFDLNLMKETIEDYLIKKLGHTNYKNLIYKILRIDEHYNISVAIIFESDSKNSKIDSIKFFYLCDYNYEKNKINYFINQQKE